MRITNKTILVLIVFIILNIIVFICFSIKNKKISQDINNLSSIIYIVEENEVE